MRKRNQLVCFFRCIAIMDADELLLRQGMPELESARAAVRLSSQVELQNGLDDHHLHHEAEDNHHLELSPAAVVRKSCSAAGNYISKTQSHQATDNDDDNLEAVSGADESQYRRPYTAATISPSKPSVVISTKKKRSSVNKKNSAPVESSFSAQRPRSAGLDGWGDFDADRLLDDDFAMQNPLDEAEEVLNVMPDTPALVADHPEPERVRTRRNRHSAPASTVHNPVEDFPAMPTPATESARQRASKGQPRPVTHAFRQRPLAVVDFDPTGSSRSKTLSVAASKQSRLSGLRGRTQPPTGGCPPPSPSPSQQQHNCLPQIGQAPLQQQQPPSSTGPLFGTFLPDTHETRTLVFERFRQLWTLMSSRSSSAYTTASTSSLSLNAEGETVACKSSLECSMMLMKICKLIGISLGSSTSTSSLSFWSSKERNVDFNAFCDFVIRNAIHPALQHFLKDEVSSVDEYVCTLDRILHNVIAAPTIGGSSQQPVMTSWSTSGVEEHRVKELAEIQPLFPQWKVGITSLGKQKAGTKAATTGPTGGSEAIISHPATPDPHDDNKGSSRLVGGPTLLFPSRWELTFQLPAEEAKATHSENIRRKVQLHKSWQPHAASLNVSSNNIAALHAVSERCCIASYPPVSYSPMLPTNNNTDVCGVNHRLLGCASSPQRSGTRANQEEGHQESATAIASEHCDHEESSVENNEDAHTSLKEVDQSPERDYHQIVANEEAVQQQVEEQVLVCGECTAGEAVLWCASCFGVFCVSCWQTLHLLSVDTSVISEQNLSSETVLAPTAKPLKPSSIGATGSNNPPVAMLYLPTKPLAAGKLAKGACSKWRSPHDEIHDEQQQNAVSSCAASMESHTPMLTVSSHAILPPLPKTQSLKTLDRKSSGHHESTSNMVKALMLGVSTLSSTSGSSSSNSPAATSAALMAPRKYADPKKRVKLHPAAVLLDPAQLFADA